MNKKELILNNLDIIEKVAKYYYENYKDYGIEYDDLYQESVLFLCTKVNSLNENYNIKQYIYFVVSNHMKDYILENITYFNIDKIYKKYALMLDEKMKDFKEKNNRQMTYDEMLEYLKKIANKKLGIIDLELITELFLLRKSCFVDSTMTLDQAKEEIDSNNFENDLVYDLSKDSILYFIKNINIRYFNILAGKYGLIDGEEKTLADLAKENNLSHEGIRRSIFAFRKEILRKKRLVKEYGLK